MAEATIGHLIEVIREENDITRSDTKENTKELISLNKTFSAYFKSLKADDLDEAEDKREKKEKVSGKDFESKIGAMSKRCRWIRFSWYRWCYPICYHWTSCRYHCRYR